MSSFNEWVPEDYLAEYFSELQQDEKYVIRYFVEHIRSAEFGPVLCFGCGPGLNHAFLTVPYASDLILADYLPGNLDQIERWQRNPAAAHDWTEFIRFTLLCESGAEPSQAQLATRSDATRTVLTKLAFADAGLMNPLGEQYRGKFATVLSPFCADSVTSRKDVWARYSRNIASLVRPGGLMLTAALARSEGYRVGTRYFPSANISESDLRAVLAEDFLHDSIEVETREVSEQLEQGYSSIFLASSRKA